MKQKQVAVRIEPELENVLKQLADHLGVSFNAYVTQALLDRSDQDGRTVQLHAAAIRKVFGKTATALLALACFSLTACVPPAGLPKSSPTPTPVGTLVCYFTELANSAPSGMSPNAIYDNYTVDDMPDGSERSSCFYFADKNNWVLETSSGTAQVAECLTTIIGTMQNGVSTPVGSLVTRDFTRTAHDSGSVEISGVRTAMECTYSVIPAAQ